MILDQVLTRQGKHKIVMKIVWGITAQIQINLNFLRYKNGIVLSKRMSLF